MNSLGNMIMIFNYIF